MWVYTAHGEEVGRLHGVSRPAGQQAMCGYKPVDGYTAKAWEKNGYIEWKEETPDDGSVGNNLLHPGSDNHNNSARSSRDIDS